jgi:prophage regulatory protein
MQAHTGNTSDHSQHPPTLLKRPAVEQLTTLSRSRIYDLMDKGEFPKPVRLGSMSVAWLESEIHQWVSERIDASRKAGE